MRHSPVVAALVALLTAAPALAQEAPPDEPQRVATADIPTGFTAPGAPTPYVQPAYAPQPYYAPPPSPASNPLPAASFGQDTGRDTVSAPPRPKSDVAFDIGVGTEVPISVGGLATLEVPGRILFQLGAGVMPKGYVNAIDGFLTSIGAYDQAVSGLVRGSLGNSFVLKASAGWRPFSDHGLEILGGYTLMTMGGSVTAGDAINAVLGESGSALRVPAGMTAEVPLAATLHNVHVSLGWRWLLADDHLVIRASATYLQTVAANVNVSLANMSAVAAYEGQVNTAINDAVSPFFKTYAKLPTLGLSAAYRF